MTSRFPVSLLTLFAGCTALYAGCGADSPAVVGLEPLTTNPSFAVVSTDFTSTSIGMLDEAGVPINAQWFDSGTTLPGLVASLSGDVVLPTVQESPSTFTVIDRFRTDVISRFEVPSGALIGQMRTHDVESQGAGFSSNPQDVIFVSNTEAWVVRYAPNLDAQAEPINAGTDLVEFDPGTMRPTGRRIDLSPLNLTETSSTIFTRPSRAVRIGDQVVVGSERIDASFGVAGPGIVALINLTTGSVGSVDLSEHRNCGNVQPIPESDTKVMIACLGFGQPYGDEAQTRATAALIVLELDDSGAQVARVWRPDEDSTAPVAVQSMIPLSDTQALAVANGGFSPAVTPDVLYLVDFVTGQATRILEGSGPFALGRGALDPNRIRVLLPDSARGVLVLEPQGSDAWGLVETIEIQPELGLGPVGIYALGTNP
jgi:hypothetical protein